MSGLKYALVNSEGEIQGTVLLDTGDTLDGTVDPYTNYTYHEIDFQKNVDNLNTPWYWNGTGWAERATRPDEHHQWTNGQWVNNFTSVMEWVRAARKNQLKNSDWTQLPDAPLTETQKQAWQTFRQQLRDLPANIPDNTLAGEIVWPDPPL